MTTCRNVVLTLTVLMMFAASAALAQSTDAILAQSAPMAATSATVVPMLVRYDGVAMANSGKAASMTFLIFKEATGGEPMWIESQTVATDAVGKYEVYLGSSYSAGLPADLFGTGEARWLEVQIAGETPAPRVLLTSVPYALKAADAATLGGLPASAFMLAAPVSAATAAISANGVTADAASNVTTTGGTSFYLPKFNAAATVINSQIYDNGTNVGIGVVPNTSVKLDVGGAMIMRGEMIVTRTGNAGASKGFPSYGFQFFSNAYNSSTKATDNPYFSLQSEPTGNNTASPSATFNLLFANNGSAAAETGFYIYPDGIVHFASGQTFTSSEPSTVAVDGTSSSNAGVQGNSTSSNGVYGTSKTGDGVQGLSAGTAPSTAGVRGVSGVGNSSGFNGIAGVWGDSNGNVGVFGSSTQADGVFGESSGGFGVEGASASSYGVIGGTSDTSSSAAGVYGYSNNIDPGVEGVSTDGNGALFYGGINIDTDGDGGSGVVAYGGGVSGSMLIGGAGGFFEGGSATEASGFGYAGSGVVGTGGEDDAGYGGYGGYFFGGYSDSSGGNGGEGLYATGGTNLYNNVQDPYAGIFVGDVSLTGTLYANAKNFQIDDPRDPANKYLNHTSIESSEMMNLYTGNVTTNDLGVAAVTLPDWFQTVNGDFRYQLTTIGKKAQAWVSQEVENGKFEISTDTPGVKVSWQITGVRQDPYAKAHPLVVEQAKDVHERGFYKNPELYGQPKEKQTEWGRNPGAMRQAQMMHQLPKASLKKPSAAAASLMTKPTPAATVNK